MSGELDPGPAAELTDAPPAPAADEHAAAVAQGWQVDSRGRVYTPKKAGRGVLYRQGNETPHEAQERAQKPPKDKPPKRRPAPKTPKAPAPTKVSVQELEAMLRDTLSSPAMIAAAKGETWAANHFTAEGATLARNLAAAAEHNPWLREKLEATLAGDVLLVRVLTLVPVASALMAYSVPAVIYYLNPGFIPPAARTLFAVPDRHEIVAERKRQEAAERQYHERLREDERRAASETAAAAAGANGAPAPAGAADAGGA